MSAMALRFPLCRSSGDRGKLFPKATGSSSRVHRGFSPGVPKLALVEPAEKPRIHDTYLPALSLLGPEAQSLQILNPRGLCWGFTGADPGKNGKLLVPGLLLPNSQPWFPSSSCVPNRRHLKSFYYPAHSVNSARMEKRNRPPTSEEL